MTNYSSEDFESKDKMQAGINFILKDQYGKSIAYTGVSLKNSESYITQPVENSELIYFNGEGMEPGEKTCEVELTFTYPASTSGAASINNFKRTITMKVNPPTATLEANSDYKPSEGDNITSKTFVENAYTLRLNGKEIPLKNAAQEDNSEYYVIKSVKWTDGDKPSAIEYEIPYGNGLVLTKTFEGEVIPAIQTDAGGDTSEDNMQDAA